MKKLLSLWLALALLALSVPALADAADDATVEAGLIDLSALRERAVADGVELPRPAEGEKLYLGEKEVLLGADRVYLAFLLSPNGRSIRRISIRGVNLRVGDSAGSVFDGAQISVSSSTGEDSAFYLGADATTLPLGGESNAQSSRLPTTIGDLVIHADGTATCRLIYTGEHQGMSEQDSGSWFVSEPMTLYNLTGDTAMAAVDPPTREVAIAAEVDLPRPLAGESLYLGAANVSQAGALYVAFLLSEDGKTMRGLGVYARDVSFIYRAEDDVLMQMETRSTNTVAPAPRPVEEIIDVDRILLTRFAVDGDTATGLLNYTFDSEKDGVVYPFDTALVQFARVEGAGDGDAGYDPDALRARAEQAGMTLPEPAEGEKLYLGVGYVPDTQQTALFLAFLLAPNGTAIRRATLFGEALEIPVPDSAPGLVNTQLSTVEDYWMDLDRGPTDFVLDPDPFIAIEGLAIDGDTATCTMSMSGHCGPGETSVQGDYSATADVTLYNLTGEAAMEAIAPPTREEVEAAGMTLPEPGEGEALYLGAANVSQADALYVAFVLSADGATVHDVSAFVCNLSIQYRSGDSRYTVTTGTSYSSIYSPMPVAETIEAEAVTLDAFAVDGDAASAVLRYIYHVDEDDLDFPFDAAKVAFAKVN